MFVNTTVLMPLIFDNHPTLPLQEDVQTPGLANPETAVLAPPATETPPSPAHSCLIDAVQRNSPEDCLGAVGA